MIITNNADFHAYLTNKGVWCIYMSEPPSYYVEDCLVIVFTNNYHEVSVCGNAHHNEVLYRQECDELLDWLECGEKVIMVSNVIKLGTPYMAKNCELLQQRYDKLGIIKQVVDTKKLGQCMYTNRLQIRYKGVTPIAFNEVRYDNIIHPKYEWVSKDGKRKSQDPIYMNIINKTHDKEERRKLRYLPQYLIFSELYRKLNL